MTGFAVWARKEVIEIRRTWRLWVLPGLLLALAIVSPVLADVTPELVRSFASEEPGVIIELPDPVPADATRQWGQSISQIVLFAVIITSAGLVSNELRSGTAHLVLTKPLSRSAFILSKALVQMGFLAVATGVGTIVCGIVTRIIFGTVPVGDLAQTTAVWLALAAMLIAVMTLLSTVLGSQAAAAGTGIAVYFAITIAGLWRPARDYTPAGLFTAIDELASGQSPGVAIPAIGAMVTGAVALIVAVLLFARKPLLGRTGQG